MRRLWRWLSGLLGRGPRERLDADVRDIFLGELDELTALLVSLRPVLQSRPDEVALREVRRAFHTIKGSGLMVGAVVLGSFCGRMEKLSLSLVEKRCKAPKETLELIDNAIDLLPGCARAIRADRPLPGAINVLDRRARSLLGDADLIGA